MREKITRLLKGSVCILLAAIMLATSVSVPASAAALVDENDDPVVVVSLGDSYSSGEGITPFYGQEKPEKLKVRDKNWLAHRSRNSWGGMLKVKVSDNVTYTMKDYFVDEGEKAECKWYFRAASGALTEHFNKSEQTKTGWTSLFNRYTDDLPKQLAVFDEIHEKVDYVTFTIGGNDMGFADILTNCALGSGFLGTAAVEIHLSLKWLEFYKSIRQNIKQAYLDVHDKAKDATIIVAGYPTLLSMEGTLLSLLPRLNLTLEDAVQVNKAALEFNRQLEKIVKECQNEMDIRFVDVAGKFEGHEAYAANSWINPLMLIQPEDINQFPLVPISSFSMHPNIDGAKAYADCVNKEIERAQKDRRTLGTLSGKVCKASDRTTPVSDASITVYKDRSSDPITTVRVDTSGNYNIKLPEYDSYRIEISAPGYIPFSSFAKVVAKTCTYTETFLMVEGTEGMTGTATGIISDALTGKGVYGVGLIIRKGWNNHSYGDVVDSAITDANGAYSVTLPLGNYTLCTYKEGYIAGMVNIVVQEGTTGSQNGTITPVISGDSYQIVLTWGENPRDLDSHVEGPLSNGDGFHVYYGHKSQYDGDTEVCNLDVDDTTSYGPETITLNPVASGTYYYYIYRYAGSGTVASSGAKITVYQGGNKVTEFNVPTNQGSGDYWNVFAIKDGQLIIQNTITSSKDVSYASSTATYAANFAGEENTPKKDDAVAEDKKLDAIPEEAKTELLDELERSADI